LFAFKASTEEIAIQYSQILRIARNNADHPDSVKHVQYAYEILSDPAARKLYDESGLEGLQTAVQWEIYPYAPQKILDRIKELESQQSHQHPPTGTSFKCWVDASSILDETQDSNIEFLGILLSSAYSVKSLEFQS
jgi:curved DNA-binding protein CbpA